MSAPQHDTDCLPAWSVDPAYQPPSAPSRLEMPTRHSEWGRISLLLGLLSLGTMLLLFGLAVWSARRGGVSAEQLIYSGRILVACVAALVVGSGIAFVGVLQSDRRRLLSHLGLLVNGVPLAAFAVLLLSRTHLF